MFFEEKAVGGDFCQQKWIRTSHEILQNGFKTKYDKVLDEVLTKVNNFR